MKRIEFEFDPNKDITNTAKHGVSLALVSELDWSSLIAQPDDKRPDYGETRIIGYALRGERLYCVVYTDRGMIRRIISLRKANNREISDYVNACNTS